ncbi:4014_t:CDS:2, partial [Cetraspora pellucida]
QGKPIVFEKNPEHGAKDDTLSLIFMYKELLVAKAEIQIYSNEIKYTFKVACKPSIREVTVVSK